MANSDNARKMTDVVPYTSMHGAISWRSIFGGLFVSLLTFWLLMSLNLAISGITLAGSDFSDSLKASGMFGGFWMFLSVLLSVAAGSYFTARISVFYSRWICMAEGLVIASLFMGFLAFETLMVTSWAARAGSALVSGAAQAGMQAASATDLGSSDVVEDYFGDVQFRTDPKTVVAGVASRMVRGDVESAKNYLARNTNLTRGEINTRIDNLNVTLKKTAEDARLATAKAFQVTGWTLFGTLALSLLGAVLGGFAGSKVNQKWALSEVDYSRMPFSKPVYSE